jgi:hypothetical protein
MPFYVGPSLPRNFDGAASRRLIKHERQVRNAHNLAIQFSRKRLRQLGKDY